MSQTPVRIQPRTSPPCPLAQPPLVQSTSLPDATSSRRCGCSTSMRPWLQPRMPRACNWRSAPLMRWRLAHSRPAKSPWVRVSSICCVVMPATGGRPNWCSRRVFHDCTQNPVMQGDPRLIERLPPHKTLFRALPDKGLPIGNLNSQFFANVYLNALDQFVKHELKCRWYLRYCDDFVLLARTAEQLREWQRFCCCSSPHAYCGTRVHRRDS